MTGGEKTPEPPHSEKSSGHKLATQLLGSGQPSAQRSSSHQRLSGGAGKRVCYACASGTVCTFLGMVGRTVLSWQLPGILAQSATQKSFLEAERGLHGTGEGSRLASERVSLQSWHLTWGRWAGSSSLGDRLRDQGCPPPGGPPYRYLISPTTPRPH